MRIVNKFVERQIAKIDSRLPRIQQQAKIRRRYAMRHQRRLGLHDIRNQPALLAGAEFTEKPPSAQCRIPQQLTIAGLER